MISTLTGSSSSKILRSWKATEPYVTGYDIECDYVKNVAYGQIVYIGYNKDEKTYDINVKCNNDEILRYCHLRKVNVHTAEWVETETLLGHARDFVHFEYATLWSTGKEFPVRVNQFCYFKQDPTPILEGKYLPSREVDLTYDMTTYNKQPYYNSLQSCKEFNWSRK